MTEEEKEGLELRRSRLLFKLSRLPEDEEYDDLAMRLQREVERVEEELKRHEHG